MRVKHSVDFRVAPKKSSKGKGVAAEPSRDKGWVASKYSESNLETFFCWSFAREIHHPMASCLGWGSSVWKYGWNRSFCPLFCTEIGAPLFGFLFWAPVLLRNPASPLNPKFFCSYFHLRTFVWSFSRHRAPFWTLPISIPSQAPARLLQTRCSRWCGSSA